MFGRNGSKLRRLGDVDAKSFTLRVDDVEFLEDKSAVFDLGVLTARSYDPSSASDTATAGQ